MYCTKCGAELPAQAQFCSKCGTAAVAATTAVPIAEPLKVAALPERAPDFWGWNWRDAGIRLLILGGICAAANAYNFQVANPFKSIGYASVVGVGSTLLYFAIVGGLIAIVRKIMPSTRGLPVARSFGLAIGVTFIINILSAGCALMVKH